MNMVKKTETQENLRELAWELDLRMGLEQRKIILEGNEKITLSTSGSNWKEWVFSVEKRLNEMVATEAAKKLIMQGRLLILKQNLSLLNGN
jgi:hypothetical protein